MKTRRINYKRSGKSALSCVVLDKTRRAAHAAARNMRAKGIPDHIIAATLNLPRDRIEAILAPKSWVEQALG